MNTIAKPGRSPIPSALVMQWCRAAGYCILILLGASASVSVVRAQGAGQSPTDSAPQDNPLASGQSQLATRFKKLEGILLRSAEIEAVSNPTRAALMRQAAALAKQVQLSDSLVRAARSLEQKQYSQAIEDQKASLENLNKILELLQSENRTDRVREQRDQIRRTIEETERLLRLQSSLRGRTEGGSQTEKAASDQQKLAEKAAQIAKDLNPDDAKDKEAASKPDSQDTSEKDKSEQSDKPGDQESSKENGNNKDSQSPEGKKTDGKKTDDKKSSDKKTDEKQADKQNEDKNADKKSEGKPDKKSDDQKSDQPAGGENKDAKDQASGKAEKSDKPGESEKSGEKPPESDQKPSGQPSQSKPSQSKPSQSKPSQSKPGDRQQSEDSQKSGGEQSEESESQQQPKNPTDRAAQRMKQAQKRMQEAQKNLEDAERKGAVEKQRQAEQELKTAIEELEEILRQLREEEIERSLSALEERLRLMLQLQNKVLDESKRLQEISAGGNDRQVEIRANSLASDEKKILGEAQRALLLLREEGTSAAFPESLSHIISDMQKVVERLSKADVGKLTIGIEEDIVSSLEELVAAMSEIKKENKDRKEKPMPAPGGQQAPPGEQPLVNQLAEMRLIKTLQVRINKRTQTLSEVLKDPNDVVGQAEAADIQSQLRELAERQSSIKQVTRDIVIGKNQQ